MITIWRCCDSGTVGENHHTLTGQIDVGPHTAHHCQNQRVQRTRNHRTSSMRPVDISRSEAHSTDPALRADQQIRVLPVVSDDEGLTCPMV